MGIGNPHEHLQSSWLAVIMIWSCANCPRNGIRFDNDPINWMEFDNYYRTWDVRSESWSVCQISTYFYYWINEKQQIDNYSPINITSMLYVCCMYVICFSPCGLGDQNSANVCPCACRKRPLIMGYKLSYPTGLLYARSSCMRWCVWVWTVGYWVVLVQVIYCSKSGWVLFLKNQRHPERRSRHTATVVSPIFP